jgi:hypothetical protein
MCNFFAFFIFLIFSYFIFSHNFWTISMDTVVANKVVIVISLYLFLYHSIFGNEERQRERQSIDGKLVDDWRLDFGLLDMEASKIMERERDCKKKRGLPGPARLVASRCEYIVHTACVKT